jgi:hypothetical protein
MAAAEHDAQKAALWKGLSPRMDTANPVHRKERVPRTVAHPECARSNRPHDIIDVADLQETGEVGRKIVRNALLLHAGEGTKAARGEGHANPLIVEGVPERSLSTQRVADHPQAAGIHAIVLFEQVKGLEHVEEIFGGEARAVEEAVRKKKRFLLAAFRSRVLPCQGRRSITIFKAKMIWTQYDIPPPAELDTVVVHPLASEAGRLGLS